MRNNITQILMPSMFFVFSIILISCGSSTDSNSSPTQASIILSAEELISTRPFLTKVPANYDPETAIPLILLLHGFGGSGDQNLRYFGFDSASERHGFIVAYPEGLVDPEGRQYWNATNICCDLYNKQNDDVNYISVIIENIEENFNIDPNKIYIVGHSNGGYMSHRLACDLSDRVAAIVSLAGATWKDPLKCQINSPVSILQVHGDLDDVVFYHGGSNPSGALYPSAFETVSGWANRNGCLGELVDIDSGIDIDQSVEGNETRLQRFTQCPSNGEVELWTIINGGHIPEFDSNWADLIWAFLNSHPKS